MFTVFLTVVAAAPVPVVAQDRGIATEQLGRIILRLVDADTREPVAGALVTLTTLNRRALTDAQGQAVFQDVPPGDHAAEIRHIAYGNQSASVDVQAMQSTVIAIPLVQEAIAVEPLEVLVEYRPRYLEEQGFYDRRVDGMGSFFDPMFVDRWGQGAQTSGSEFIDLLVDMSPQLSSAARARASNGNGWQASIGNGFGGQCPAIYIDGQRTFNDPGLNGRPSLELDMLATYTIGAVEIYPSSQGVPYFALEPEVGCGSIVIWTNRWRGRARELEGAEIELCVPKDPGTVVVEGTIRDEYTGVLLPGAHVMATTHPSGRPRAAKSEDITSDRFARYRICDLPPGQRVSLKVATADVESDEILLDVGTAPVDRDLTIRVAGPGHVAGRVLDRDTGRPVVAADIAVLSEGSRTQTDNQGYFRLEEVLPGDHMIQITHLGFDPINEVVSIVADRTVDVNVQMSADPIELEPIVVTAVRDRRLEMRGFYERRIWGERGSLGHYFDQAAIERAGPALTSSLLRTVPGVEVRCQGSRDCTVGSQRVNDCARMNVFINGNLALGERRRDPLTIDELVRPSEIAAVEVYAGGASAPAEFSGSSGRCGAVVIWTK